MAKSSLLNAKKTLDKKNTQQKKKLRKNLPEKIYAASFAQSRGWQDLNLRLPSRASPPPLFIN